jgi:CyaY protein
MTTMTTIDEATFEAAADRTLASLRSALDALALDAEVELAMGILSIEFADGAKYIVNSHRAAKQIWMAAERSAWHFDLEGDRWIATKSGDELRSALAGAVGRKLGVRVDL